MGNLQVGVVGGSQAPPRSCVTMNLRGVYTASTRDGHHVVVRVIRCDCGFEAAAEADEALIAEAQGHAREVHGMDVPAQLILELARPRSPGPKAKT